MNILGHIKELCEERNWTIYKLADEAGITQSTLSNMFYRGTLPSLSTLAAICNAFDITLSQFFDDTNSTLVLTRDEELFITQYRQLAKKDKKIINVMLTEMTKNTD